MRPALKWTGIGCGGVIGVLVLFTIVSALLGRGSGPPATATPTAIVAQPTRLVPTSAPVAAATPTAAPKPTEPPPPAATPTAPAPAAPQRVWVTGSGADGINMRAEPSTSAARVKGLKDGAELEIIGADRQADGRAWRNVKDPGDAATGWIAAEFSSATAPPPALVAPAPQPAPAPKPVAPAPNPAPPPSSGAIICNDGSTWPGTTRQGACNRRGGIKPGY